MTKPPKSIAFYLRVSTTAQDYPAQLHAIREFCTRKGWPLPKKGTLFSEKISGVRVKRRELDRLLQACREGKFDCVVSYKVNRLARSMLHLLQIRAELRAIGIRIIGVADGIDTADDSPAGNLYWHILTSFAEYDRENILENTRAGQAAAAKAGRFPGRPRKNQAKIEQVFALNAQNIPGKEIARRTGLTGAYVSMLLSGNRQAKAPKRISHEK